MSTRCCEKVIESWGEGEAKITRECMLYHHHDGYPEGVGHDLKRRFVPGDTKYPWDIDTIVNDLIKDRDDEYEFTAFNHPDIEYLYTIDCNAKTIKCNKCRWKFEDENEYVADKSEIGDEVPIP